MKDESSDLGTIQVLAERLDKFRLPRVLELKARVDRGTVLNENDIAFLERVLHDSQAITGLLDRHPEWQELASKVSSLYKEITEKALENEKAQGKN
jgi:hypothetical protein